MKNINKQEELVSALWDFAKGLQKSDVVKSSNCTRSVDKDGFETKMDMDVFHKTFVRIADNFKLEIQEIQ